MVPNDCYCDAEGNGISPNLIYPTGKYRDVTKYLLGEAREYELQNFVYEIPTKYHESLQPDKGRRRRARLYKSSDILLVLSI